MVGVLRQPDKRRRKADDFERRCPNGMIEGRSYRLVNAGNVRNAARALQGIYVSHMGMLVGRLV